MTTKKDCLTEGFGKQVFNTDDPQVVLIHYTDRTAAYNNLKKATIVGKGLLITKISAIIFSHLHRAGIPTHYIETVNEREQLAYKAQVFPLEIIARNISAGSTVQRIGIAEGTRLKNVIYNLYYNNKSLDKPLINDSEALALGIVEEEELKTIYRLADEINRSLSEMFRQAGILLVDMKLSFGRLADGRIALTDEITPETSRMWDIKTERKLDKDRFRRDMGDILAAYEEVYNRLSTL